MTEETCIKLPTFFCFLLEERKEDWEKNEKSMPHVSRSLISMEKALKKGFSIFLFFVRLLEHPLIILIA
jgi:hypothetical protein